MRAQEAAVCKEEAAPYAGLPDSALRRRITGTDIAVCCSLALLMLSSYVLNTYVFPVVANVFPLGREISTYCGVVFSLVVAVAAYRKPVVLRERVWSIACLALFAFGLVLLYVGLATGSTELVALGSPFGGIGSVWFSVLAGLALIKLGPARSLVVIPAAFLVKYVVQMTLSGFGSSLPLEAALVLYFACTALAYVLIRKRVRRLIDDIRTAASPTVLDVTNPSSFLPFSSPVFVSIFLFNAACGYAFASQGEALAPTAALLSFMPVVVVFFVAVAAHTRFSADALYQAAALLVFAGFLFAPLTLLASAGSEGLHVSSMLLYAGADCFSVLTYFLIAAVGARNLSGALSTSAFVAAAGWLGIGCGALAAQAIVGLAGNDPVPMLAAMACITFVFMLYNFVGLKKFCFEDAIQGIRPVPRELAEAAGSSPTRRGASSAQAANGSDVATGAVAGNFSATKNTPEPETDDASSAFERTCTIVAERFGLTSREVDVLRLLARGRTSPIIQEKLYLSHNTVKTHVRHIYAKMNIHSQQELIDIVESSGNE
ncbi:response regulator transcription factor [Gordonibacter sp.]|uniref:response regulator transcription factor n=1 Tax=Gordonibacter sp. TaxID=1968902 RepID=UPI002FC73AEF